MTTPAARQTSRRSAGTESTVTHGDMGNGSLFTLKGGAPQAGSCGYGPQRFMHQVGEAAADGGVQTGDHHLAAAIKGMGIYDEVKL